MKANSTKRKIFDAVDLLTEDTSSQMPVKTMKGGVTMLDIDSIKPFHNHPFHLYEGDRLDDMVESIRDHGILNPVIVREIDDGYEMLSGHNRQKAAKIAGLKKIPAIIKYDLPDTDAYVYVIETNLMQRSFSDLEISEKAAVLKERYDKVLYQRQRESIMAEVAKLEGKSDIKNYSDYLFENAGSYVLAWIIEGARKAIEADFHLERPKVVADAIAEYRGMNDWLEHFLEECCVRGDGLEEKSGELYQEYRSYCLRTGEISRNNADFTAVLEKAGYTRKKKKTGMWVQGLQLKDTDFAE